jgi:tRNA A-37 threonylcarbamoyl transferase component Bud32
MKRSKQSRQVDKKGLSTALANQVFSLPRTFRKKRIGRLIWWLRTDLEDAPIELLQDPERFLRAEERSYDSQGKEKISVGTRYVIKSYPITRLRTRFRYLLKRSKAEIAARSGLHQESNDINTAPVIGFAVLKSWGLPEISYLLTRTIPNCRPLNQLLESKNDAKNALSLSLVRRIARLIAHLHHSGTWHRDLNVSNVVIDHEETPFILDLGAARVQPRISDKQAAVDLGRFARLVNDYPRVNRSVCQFFFREYCRFRGIKRIPRPDVIRDRMRRYR